MIMDTHLQFFGFSDPGKIRNRNEDSYLCNGDEKLFLVADGMGGHASGETASHLAVVRTEEFVRKSRTGQIRWPLSTRKELSLEQNRLLSAVSFANHHILNTAKKNPEMEGMGTTLVGVLMEQEGYLAVVNIGDSRLYRVRDSEILQITKDHTLVGEQERQGILSRDEAKKHPQRHILTRALGTNDSPRVDVYREEIKAKDVYLICSDGLHDMLEDRKLLETVHSISDGSLYKIGMSLVLNANLAGGMDNITVILLAFNPESTEEN